MNEYRVDRAREAVSPPCGMNSILYVGESLPDALAVFDHTAGGRDAWSKPNPDYGVMLSIWNQDRGEYTVKRWKSK
jgi:hypothetical protein